MLDAMKKKGKSIRCWYVLSTCNAWNNLSYMSAPTRSRANFKWIHTLRRNDETASLGRTAVNCLYDINQLANTSVGDSFEKRNTGDTPLVCYPWPNY